jgi:hypothetical protein
MLSSDTLTLFQKHVPVPVTWTDIVTGYDFGLLEPNGIQDWVRRQNPSGPACVHLLSLEGADLLRFEESLWAACAEATEKHVARPGHLRWTQAQDSWRLVLLKEAMAQSPETFFDVARDIYEMVGCPEDMLDLWKRPAAPTGQPDWSAVHAFISKLETSLLSCTSRSAA